MDQRELVVRAGRGDQDAFASLAGASIARLEAVARLILRDDGLAQDAVQEALIRAWRDLPGLRDPDRFDAWFQRLIVNACLDAARRRRRRPIEVDLTEIEPPLGVNSANLIADRDELEHGLRRLSVDQRALLVLHYYLGLPTTSVAEMLGVPLGTAQSRLHRALEAMRAALLADELSATSDPRRRDGMTGSDRLERDLTDWFAETAAPRTPPYLDDILRQTVRRRQRPRWTFFERLLPMTATASFRAATGNVPWRALGVLAILVLVVVVGAVLIGSTQHRVPAPFGPARAGQVSYAMVGGIYVVTPATNERRSIVTGPDTDHDPQWSRDGTRIVFERGDGNSARLFTVKPDELTS